MPRRTRSCRPPITASPSKGATLYTTFSPCLLCAKMIINAGIKEVVYHTRYSIDDVSLALLHEAGVVVRPLAEEDDE